jgi:hypothetical protein
MNFLRKIAHQKCNNKKNNNDNELAQWAAIAAFFVLLGDFISFILAVMETQNNSNNNSCYLQDQVKSLEEKITYRNKTNQEIIKLLEEKINELKTTLGND